MDGHKVAAALGDRIGHVHGKDTVFHAESLALNGLLDRRWPEPAAEMPWTFAVPGRGHDLAWWTGLVRTLGGSQRGSSRSSTRTRSCRPPMASPRPPGCCGRRSRTPHWSRRDRPGTGRPGRDRADRPGHAPALPGRTGRPVRGRGGLRSRRRRRAGLRRPLPHPGRLHRLARTARSSARCGHGADLGQPRPDRRGAARAGRHVFVEKPMCFSAAEGRAMVAAAEQAGVKLMTGYPKRYDPAFERHAGGDRRGSGRAAAPGDHVRVAAAAVCRRITRCSRVHRFPDRSPRAAGRQRRGSARRSGGQRTGAAGLRGSAARHPGARAEHGARACSASRPGWGT